MTNQEAIRILSEVIPKGSPDFERLYRVYDYVTGDKKLAIDVFNTKWKDCNIEALEKVIKMYLEDHEYLSSFGLFLDRELESYIQIKQRRLEQEAKIPTQLETAKMLVNALEQEANLNLKIGEIKCKI